VRADGRNNEASKKRAALRSAAASDSCAHSGRSARRRVPEEQHSVVDLHPEGSGGSEAPAREPKPSVNNIYIVSSSNVSYTRHLDLHSAVDVRASRSTLQAAQNDAHKRAPKVVNRSRARVGG
jgi:hypothetical protein